MTARLLLRTRTILALLVGAALVAGLTAATSSAATAAPTTIQFTGTVSDPGGYPLPGMSVLLVRVGDEESEFPEAFTGGKGDFATTKVQVSATTKYQLTVSDPTGRHLTAYSKEFAATAANRKQNLTLAPAAVIRGKVSTKDGDDVRPAPRILIEANGTDTAGNPAGGFAFTSTKGAFSLGGLPGGTYRLQLTDYDEDGTRGGPLFSNICYDNILQITGNCSDSTTITVTAGKVTTLHPQVLGHRQGIVSGTVTDASGAPLKNRSVTIVAANDESNRLGSATTTADGSWTDYSIEFAGKVKILVEDPFEVYRTTWYKNAVDFGHATPLLLKDEGEISDITIVLPKK